MADEIGQLKRLFDLLEEHLNTPAALIQIAYATGSPRQIVRNERKDLWNAVDLYLCGHQTQLLGIGLKTLGCFQFDQNIPENLTVRG